MKTIVLNVEMACAGCSNAVIRLLKKVEGKICLFPMCIYIYVEIA